MDRSAVRRRRRFPVTLVVIVLGALGIGAVVNYVVVPNFRPTLYAAEEYGVGVSTEQGEIDWPLVRADDVGFAYVKATEGSAIVDPAVGSNVLGAVSVGISTGVLHVFTLCTPGRDQADNLIDALDELPVDSDALTLPLAVDLGLRGECDQWPSGDDLEAELQEFFEEVGPTVGEKFVLSVDDAFDERYSPATRFDHPYWRSSLFRRPADPFAIWRVNRSASVDGIDGDVDLHVARASLAVDR